MIRLLGALAPKTVDGTMAGKETAAPIAASGKGERDDRPRREVRFVGDQSRPGELVQHSLFAVRGE